MTTSISGQSAFYPPRAVKPRRQGTRAGVTAQSMPHFGNDSFGKPGRMQRFAKWPERQAYRLLDYWEKSLNRIKKWVSGGMMISVASLSCLPMPKWFMNGLARRYFFSPRSVSSSLLLNSEKLFEEIDETPFRLNNDKTVRCEAWHLKAADKTKPTILFSHGRDCNISHLGKIIKSCQDKGFGIFVYDYPGFGRSEGKASEIALYDAAESAAKKLSQLKDMKGHDVGYGRQIIMGHSLGGAVAVDLAKKLETMAEKGEIKDKPQALVVINTFSNIKDALGDMHNKLGTWGKKMISTESLHKRIDMRFDSANKIKALKMPVLGFHADKDKFVDHKLGKKLFAEAGKHKFNEFVTLANEPHSLTPESCKTVVDKVDVLWDKIRKNAEKTAETAIKHRV